MLTGAERYSFFADPLKGAPAAGVGQDNSSGHVHTVDLGVKGSIWEVKVGCRPQLDGVIAARRHVDGVGEPLAGLEVVHHVAAAGGVGGHDDVHILAEPVLAALIARSVVVVDHAFAAAIKILRLESCRNRYGGSGIGGWRLGRDRQTRSKKKRSRGNPKH